MTVRTLVLHVAAASALLFGCGGTSLDQGGYGGGFSAGSGGFGAVGGGAGGTGGRTSAPTQPPLHDYSPDEVQTALAQCELAHGPVVSPVTYADKRALMLGAWVVCPPAATTVYSPGIVFAGDGTFNRLLSDGNGGLVPGYGVQNQGEYYFPFGDDQKTNGNPYVTVANASGSALPADFGDGPMTFEASPTRMLAIITYYDQTIEVWLVHLS